MLKQFTDRTRAVQYQRCPRSRWWAYEWEGRGVASTRVSLPLAIGIFTHEAIAKVLLAARDANNTLPTRDSIREVIAWFRDEWITFCATKGIDLAPGTNEYLSALEHQGLIEGFIWGYWHKVLPGMLEKYTILEVEQDETPIEIVDGVFWQGKADALLQDKRSSKLLALSLKTTKQYDSRKANEGYTDMQGISEVWAIEQRKQVELEGVLMQYLLVGDYRRDGRNDRTSLYSPLIRGYRDIKGKVDLDNVLTGGDGAKKLYWRWEWTNDEGETKRLHYRTHEPVLWWAGEETIGIEEWIDMLVSGKIQSNAGDPVNEQFIQPEVFFRNQQRINGWLRSIRYQERNIKVAKDFYNSSPIDSLEREQILDEIFPKWTHSCNYPSRCAFWEVCHRSSQDLAADTIPMSEGEFKWRDAHHEGEREQQMEMMEME